MAHDVNTRAPREGQPSATRRNSLRVLVRSRTVQAVLLAAAVSQGVVAAERFGGSQQNGRTPALAGAMALAPMVVPLAPALAKPVAKEAGAAKSGAQAKATALARKYSRRGYTVPVRLAEKIHSAAVANDIDPEVAFGLVRTESSFRNAATSYVGAVGLTQLMPATARWLEPGTTTRDLRDPDTNLRIGFRYLRQLIDRYEGDTRLALLAYNRGPGTVDRVLKRGGNPDNGYADKVMGRR